MRTIKRFIAIFIVTLLAVPVAPAQDRQRATTANKAISQDVQIVIQQQQVSFAARLAVEQMQLQISNQAGDLIYDSGSVAGQELNWPLQQANGETLKSGLYAYTFTFKETGAAEARVRRGHFIVDRAQDRDGQTDRLWITSRNEDGVGAELTVARNDDAVIAGTGAPSKRGDGKARSGEGDEKDKGEKKNERAALEVSGTGAPGQIAKFISEEEIGNSEIIEVEGRVGIGTSAPQNLLHVGPGASSILASRVDAVVASNKPDAGIAIAQNSGVNVLLQASGAGGYIGTTSNHPLVWRTNDLDRVVVAPNGNVGIGANPIGKLTLDGGNFVMNSTVNAAVDLGPGNKFRICGPNGGCSVAGEYIGGRIRLSSNGAFITAELGADPGMGGINAPGNVLVGRRLGVGTTTPELPLQVAGFNIQEANVRSFNERAILSLDSNINGQRRVWTLESGVFGQAGQFAIFDRTAFRARLTIDANGVTGVDTLQIRGGADFSENFDVSAETAGGEASPMKVEAGLVVSIDPANPGKLALSAQAYDRRVAGIISGAGGVKPGMIMSQEGTLADGKHPVALSGRVYCYVDASHGAIEPGDLLTTSATPGHAMKVADSAKAQGAIIGKAMTSLKEGKGLVLVLVTLQ